MCTRVAPHSSSENKRVQAALNRQKHARILYDADQLQRPTLSWFDAEYWQHQQAAEPIAGGRGGSFRVHTPVGPAMLKHYRRGGQMARISRDRYLFIGWERSRSFREWRLLAKLCAMKLPVPQPLTALCCKSGRSYQAALLTRWIDDARPLHDALQDTDVQHADGLLQATLQSIQALHAAGVYHPDVNLGNVLVDAAGKIWLIDFDRAKLLVGGSRSHRQSLQRMYARLLRSAQRWQQRGHLPMQHVQRLEEILQNSSGEL